MRFFDVPPAACVDLWFGRLAMDRPLPFVEQPAAMTATATAPATAIAIIHFDAFLCPTASPFDVRPSEGGTPSEVTPPERKREIAGRSRSAALWVVA
jgi:hypothetical protein